MRLARAQLVKVIADRIITSRAEQRATIIGIDGIDLSGKSSIAQEIVSVLAERGEKVFLIHEDDFLNPRQVRFKRGEWSMIGFYEDFFDFEFLATQILKPLRESKEVYITYERIDPKSDTVASTLKYGIGRSDLTLVEGLYLLRSELAGLFDLIIRLKIPSSLVLERALQRDIPQLGTREYVQKHYLSQPIPAQAYYENLCDPDSQADMLIDNSDYANPIILKGLPHK